MLSQPCDKSYLTYTLGTCSCTPKHRCLRNKGTQYPEVGKRTIHLRAVDLVPIPRPPIRSYKQVADFQQQFPDLIVEPIPSTSDKALSVPGASLFDEEEREEVLDEEGDQDFEDVVLKHIVTPLKLKVTPARKRIPWTEPQPWLQE